MTARKNKIVYLIVVLLSILFIWLGNKVCMSRVTLFSQSDYITYKGQVTEIVRTDTNEYEMGDETVTETNQIINVEILSDDKKGEVVEVSNNVEGIYSFNGQPVEVGDKVIVYYTPDAGDYSWSVGDLIRTDKLIWLCIIFFVFLLLFSGKKGISTILSLIFTCLSIFVVFVPSILAGYDIFLSSMIVCIYITLMTLLLVSGVTKKSFAAGFGCIGGVMVAGIIYMIMDKAIKLTGMVDEHSIYLTMINAEYPIDLKAIIFATIIIGALGATMDVAMSIASSLQEIKDKDPDIKPYKLILSGINIGRDIMGTMANTLVLAYIGCSLTVVLLLFTYNNSVFAIMNKEMVVVEILQTLAGSFGILFTIPITTFVSSILYTKYKGRKKAGEIVKAD